MIHPNSRVPSFYPLNMDKNEGWVSVKKKVIAPKVKTVEFVSIPKVQNNIPKHTIQNRQTSQSSQSSQSSYKLDEADGPIKLKTLSLEMRQEITNRRVAKQWTQADLNKFCSFPANIIREIESGRLSPNPNQLTVLNRVLQGGIHYSKV